MKTHPLAWHLPRRSCACSRGRAYHRAAGVTSPSLFPAPSSAPQNSKSQEGGDAVASAALADKKSPLAPAASLPAGAVVADDELKALQARAASPPPIGREPADHSLRRLPSLSALSRTSYRRPRRGFRRLSRRSTAATAPGAGPPRAPRLPPERCAAPPQTRLPAVKRPCSHPPGSP